MEMLVVIAIITILAFVGLNSYRSSKANLALNLETDKIIAELNSMRSKVKSPIRGERPICEGAAFSKDSAPQKISGEYAGPKAGCAQFTLYGSGLTQETAVYSLKADSTEVNSLTVFFTPPSGAMKISAVAEKHEIAEIILSLKTNTSARRAILINASTGSITLKK